MKNTLKNNRYHISKQLIIKCFLFLMQESSISLLVSPRLKSIFKKKLNFLKINIFCVYILFWCADVKNNF